LRRIAPDVPIIIVTGTADEELARSMRRAGAFDYLVKPVTGHHLSVIVGAATGQPWSVAWDASGPRGRDAETRQIERIAYTVMALARRLSVAAHRATVEQLGHEGLRAALLGRPDDAIAHLRALDTLLMTDTLPALPRTDAVALREALRPLLAGASPRAPGTTVREPDNTDLAGLRVLVVDDTPDVVELLSVVLRECGAIVVGAKSAREALEAFHRERVDVVVTDLAMPGYDGFWLIEQLRRRAESRRLVAIAVSGVMRDERGRILQAGFDDFLQKPLEPTELCRRVAHLIAA
jgi:CheY-like chemotaxis protein